MSGMGELILNFVGPPHNHYLERKVRRLRSLYHIGLLTIIH